MMTRLAPAVRCFCAPSRAVNSPVDSTTYWAPNLAHGSSAGSLTDTHGILRPLITIASAVAEMSAFGPAVRRIVLQQVRQILGRHQIVNPHELDVLVQHRRAKNQTTDPTKPIDADFQRHCLAPSWY